MVRKFLLIGVFLLGIFLAFSFHGALAGSASKVVDPISPQNVPTNQLVKVTYGDPDLLDPASDYETGGSEIIQQIYDPLLALKREKADEFVPMLATTWNIAPAGDVYTFTIRQGVRFHNGNSLTAEDVAYTFQRGILQGGGLTPQWLFSEPFLGTGISDICLLIDESTCDSRTALLYYQDLYPELVYSACQAVKNAISYDNETWQVTFHLSKAWGPMLQTLTGAWGSIIDKEWSIAQGAWDGDCATWQNYYVPAPSANPLGDVANGTGAFKFDHWTLGNEIVLLRNDQYWRSEPMWEGGPSGPSMFSSYSRQIVDDAALRKDMLLNGNTDLSLFPSDYVDEIYDQVLFAYDDPAGVEPTLIHPTGTLKLYRGGLSTTGVDAFFNYDIQTGGAVNYLGSGLLDGNGIPADFFTDIHIRKAFNFSFDWDEYNSQMFGGSGVQRTGPIISGLPGYDPLQPKYVYSPTLALQEFNLAWGGQVAANGFTIVLAYNVGNAQRQLIADILKDNIEALDPDFNVSVVGLEWDPYRSDQNNHRLPLFSMGWIQDLPHPHNWVVPYLIGIYADRQLLPEDLQNKYEQKINACVELVGAEAETCYEDIQTSTYADALNIFLVQGKVRQVTRAEVQGYYLSQATGDIQYYYQLSKGELPAVEVIDPAVSASPVVTSTAGSTTTVIIPAGTLDEPVNVVLVPDVVTYGDPDGFQLGALSFEIQVFDANGVQLESPSLNEPVMVSIHYLDEEILAMEESSLMLFWWDGAAWVDAACGEVVRDLDNNLLEVPICHFSSFAVGGISHEVYLPVIKR